MSAVFISYARRTSAAAATALELSLRSTGSRVFLDTSSIEDAEEFPRAIVSAILDSSVFVVLLDEAYLRSWYCIRELRIALAARARAHVAAAGDDALERKAPAIVIGLVKEIQQKTLEALPPDLRMRNWRSVSDIEGIAIAVRKATAEDSFGLFLREDDNEIRALVEESRLPPPAELRGRHFPLEFPPSLHERFVGRSEELWTMQFHLVVLPRSGKVVSAPTVLLEGLAGVGKSRLAREYVYRFGIAHFPGGIFWVDAGVSEAELALQFHELVRVICRIVNVSDPRAELVKWADAQDDPVLLVVDNLPAGDKRRLSHWCPLEGHAAVLATTRERRSAWEKQVSAIEVRPLDDRAGAAMLASGLDPRVAAEETWRTLAHAVGGLPVALQLLNSILRQRGWQPADVEKLIAKQGTIATLDDAFDTLRLHFTPGQLRAVAGTFETSLAMLSTAANGAAHRLALLSSAPIPSVLANRLADATTRVELTRESIILPASREDGSIFGVMHQLVADYLNSRGTGRVWMQRLERLLPVGWQPRRARLRASVRETTEAVIAILSDADEQESTLVALAPHIESLCAIAEPIGEINEWPRLFGAYAGAVQRFSYGKSHSDVLESLKASIRSSVSTAKTTHIETLTLADRIVALDHPAVPGELEISCFAVRDPTKKTADYTPGGNNDRAANVAAMGTYAPRIKEIYAIRRTFLGEDHIATIGAAAWLAFGYFGADDKESIGKWFGHLYDGCKVRYGERAPNTLVALWHVLINTIRLGNDTPETYKQRDEQLLWLLDADPKTLDPRLGEVRANLAMFTDLTPEQVERALLTSNSASNAEVMRGFRASLLGKKPAEARAHLTKAIELGAKDSSLLLQRADVAASMGDHEAAKSDLAEAEKRGARAEEIRTREAAIYLDEQNADGAIRAASAAIAAGSTDWRNYYIRGGLRRLEGEAVEAVSDLYRAIELRGGDESGDMGVQLARALRDLERYEESIRAVAPALRHDPHSVDALLLRGEARFQLRQLDGALADARRCLRVESRNVEALVLAGKCLVDLKKATEGRAELDHALEIEPDHWIATVYLMAASFDLHDFERGLAAADALLKKVPDSPDLLRSKVKALSKLYRLEETIAAADRALAISSDDVEVRRDRALALAILGRWDELFVECDQLFRLEPDNKLPHHLLALAMENLDRHEEAVGHLDEILAVSPDQWEVLCKRAKNFVTLGRIDDAVADLKRALRLSDEKKNVANTLFDVLSNNHRYDEAIMALETIPAEERDADIQSWLGMATRLTGRFDEARRYYDAALAADPTLRAPRLGRAYLFRSIERPYAALADLDLYLRSHPDDSTFLTERIEVLIDLGRRNDAAVDIARLAAAADGDTDLWQLGTFFLRVGSTERAIEVFEKDLADTTDDGIRMSNLAEALMHGGQLDRAATLLDQALAFEHDSWTTFLRGLLWKRAGDDDRPDRAFRTALAELDRDATGDVFDARVSFNHALYRIMLGETQPALDEYRDTAARAALTQLRGAFDEVNIVRSTFPALPGITECAELMEQAVMSKSKA